MRSADRDLQVSTVLLTLPPGSNMAWSDRDLFQAPNFQANSMRGRQGAPFGAVLDARIVRAERDELYINLLS